MRNLLSTFLILFAFFSSIQALYAQVTEYKIKAAYLFNFAKFVEWPESSFPDSSETIKIGILGQDPFLETLNQTVAGKTVKGRKFTVRRFKKVQDLEFCHILFISASERRRLPQIIRKIKGSSTLTVSEVNNFIDSGGIIRLLNKDNKVRFEIGLPAAQQADLKISSRVLRLAENQKDLQTNGKN